MRGRLADEAGPPWITCTAPGTTGEALERARGMVETRVGKIDGFGLRGEVEKERRRKYVAEPAPSVRLWLVADVEDEEQPLGRV